MVVNYRALYKQTVKNRYLLHEIDDLFDQLANARVFSSLDLAQRFHHIYILEENAPNWCSKPHLGIIGLRS